ncbi:MAG: hypothetical protein Q9162_003092 [Coniocarpon cinnabarinum]
MSDNVPSVDEVNSISNTIYTSKTSQQSLDASYALTNLILNSVGFEGLDSYGILDSIKKAATDKKNGARREGAMFALGAILERFPSKQPISEVLFLRPRADIVQVALDALADKGSTVREGAQYALDALFDHLQPEALPIGLLPVLVDYLSRPTGKWQGTVGAFNMIAKMADRAKLGTGTAEQEKIKDVLRDAMGKRLEGLIPTVEAGMHDLKAEVGKAAIKTMNSLTTLLQNDDVEPRIPLLLKSMENPSSESLAKAIHALSQTTFVAVVTSPVLALLTPLLERSLNNPSTSQEVLRQTSIVVENLTKLVHDPIEARAFLPKLQPGIKAVKDRASLPEVREIATRALDVMTNAMSDQDGNVARGAIARTKPEEVTRLVDEHLKASNIDIASLSKATDTAALAKTFISELVAEDVNQREIDRVSQSLAPYLRSLVGEEIAETVGKQIQEHYQEEDDRKFGASVKPDDGEVEIVNANFSLGYGGMLLLSHTNLRLLKGHRYGLCGRNGAGKSTLMRSIADNKLEGFPPPEEVKTCFVEHNQGEDADLSILEYLSRDPRFANEPQARIASTLEEVGFDGGPDGRQSHKVGSLSGGWKMKLALARAMLMRADVLLLDEPTNHLDVGNVKWLQEYLKKHTEITSLIVSHDSGFLDEVCTDIYHYEPGKKLRSYRGNLSEFVKIKPEAKSYYTLSATNAGFRFPPPGILSGVKSQTRSILRMNACSFTYPGSSKPSLTDVSCQLSLSSRVAIIGPNGAGKSTLIKVLTGEVVPQKGTVEKHPNLRIGYIKQHALEHVEMHLEKTPNQYLQWRYANGDDREIHMKQTRILTPEEKEQMAKYIKLGPGAEGQIEALIGRQKYKKTYQYEVKWVNKLPKHNSMVSKETLLDLGFTKLVQEFDDHESSREGLGYRVLEPKVISQHFKDIGLDPEIADHNTISGLSGGQKVKVVLAGAAWANPHLLVLDEPTNFLDRDSIGGLAVAIREYKGGVVMISHNDEFVSALCPEQWHVNEGKLVQKGHLAVLNDRFEDSGSATPLSSAPVSNAASASASAANSDAEGGELKFRAKKKKKMTRKEMKEREVRRRLRHIEWLNSPKGTPHPPDTDDEN